MDNKVSGDLLRNVKEINSMSHAVIVMSYLFELHNCLQIHAFMIVNAKPVGVVIQSKNECNCSYMNRWAIIMFVVKSH